MFLIKFVILLILSSVTSGDSVTNILLFGGNGFIGSHVTLNLLQQQFKLVNLTVVSRGNWPYDTYETVQPFVQHISCDRYYSGGLKSCNEFINFINDKNINFDYVVDFSAYEPNVIQDALDLLKDKIGVYIYISSDSVYEVCEPSKREKSIEENSKRPLDPELRQQLSESDNYGDQKLAGEELLTSQKNVPYIIFRLPDVMGSRDTTKRWWFYVLWLEIYETLDEPISVPSHIKNLTTSYVYASDVSKLISNIILGKYNTEIYNKIFNLGFDDSISLLNLLTEMSEILNIPVQFQTTENSVYMLPSVTRGPVDIKKAKNILNFEPTYWKGALNETVHFYKKAYYWFPKERGQVVEKILRLVVPEHKRNLVLNLLETRSFQGHDEL